MIVVDASVLIAHFTGNTDGEKARTLIEAQQFLGAPTLITYEVGHVLRRLLISKQITDERAIASFEAFKRLRIELYDASELIQGAWKLRQNLSFYDASYVALADRLGCKLYTLDQRLARAPKLPAEVIAL